ncbi:hypothetical protein LTR08_003927 [Meristemomyces frigidus]|nr:hypothetical protein LTR08_003927 [Meristemomyces frigidus]
MRPKSRERRAPKHRRQDSEVTLTQITTKPVPKRARSQQQQPLVINSSPPRTSSPYRPQSTQPQPDDSHERQHSFRTQSTQPLSEPDERRRHSQSDSQRNQVEEEEPDTPARAARGEAAASDSPESEGLEDAHHLLLQQHRRLERRYSKFDKRAAAVAAATPDKDKDIRHLHYASSLVARLSNRTVGRHQIGVHTVDNCWLRAQSWAQKLVVNTRVARTEVCCTCNEVKKKDELRTDIYGQDQFEIAQDLMLEWMRSGYTNLQMNFTFDLEKEEPEEVRVEPSQSQRSSSARRKASGRPSGAPRLTPTVRQEEAMPGELDAMDVEDEVATGGRGGGAKRHGIELRVRWPCSQPSCKNNAGGGGFCY